MLSPCECLQNLFRNMSFSAVLTVMIKFTKKQSTQISLLTSKLPLYDVLNTFWGTGRGYYFFIIIKEIKYSSKTNVSLEQLGFSDTLYCIRRPSQQSKPQRRG